MISKRKHLPPELRATINRTAHALAVMHELRQRQALTAKAMGQWLAGAGVEAVEETVRRHEAVAMLQAVAPDGR